MNHKGATHFTLNDRQTLERMLRKGFSKPAIAEALGKCERSIYYEIGRGLCVQRTTDLIDVEVYCADVAHRKYKDFLKEKGQRLKIGHDHALVKRLEELIMVQGFAPGAALAEIRNNGEHFDTEICENTVYNYIYRGDVFLFLTPEHLHDKGRRHYAAKSKKEAARTALSLSEYVEVMESNLEKAVFGNGIMVLPVEYTKGLEFDAVLILNPTREDYPADDGKWFCLF